MRELPAYQTGRHPIPLKTFNFNWMKRVVILLFLSFWTIAVIAQEADKVTGIWWNDVKEIKLKIEQKDGKYIGTIIYMIPEKYIDGKSPKDDKNPDEKLRDRPLVGLQILTGLEYDAKKKEWKDGTIYDPKSGNTYSCFAWLGNNDLLKMKGFVAGIRLLGRSTEWYRAE